MGKWITAQSSDTLCGLASKNGFLDCKSLRDHESNAELKNRQIKAGDKVFIPDIKLDQHTAATEKRHSYVKKGGLATIRFVRGGRDNQIKTERSISRLQISNFPTDKAGADGTAAFGGPAKWQFDANSFADPDSFKIEVSDRRATSATLDVELQALHPVYKSKLLVGHDLNWSSAAERDKRKLAVKVHKATPMPDQRFRSPYLRLVVDETDKAAKPQQTLLVTDDQPNEEKVEILDQRVRATYMIEKCPAGGDARCRVTAEAPVGGRDRSKKRIKVTVGIVRQNVGDATGFNGVTEAMIRHRVFRWLRRVYAQADMAPVLVDPKIRMLDPPPRNMLTVSDINGLPATGTTAAGAASSRMSFTVTTNRSDGTSVNKSVTLNIPRAASPAARLKPKEVADQIVALINDVNFSARAFVNAASTRSLPTSRSADILVSDKLGGRVTVSAVLSTDTGATLTMANVNLNGYQNSDGDDMENGTLHERQLIRNYDTGSDRMDCFVVGKFKGTASTRGRSYTPCLNMPGNYRPVAEIVNSCVMGVTSSSGAVMDGGNNLPYTFPHELGHALLDCFHTSTRSELMAGGGTSVSAAVDGTKRLCDDPITATFGDYDPSKDFVNDPNPTQSLTYSSAARLGTINTSVFSSW